MSKKSTGGPVSVKLLKPHTHKGEDLKPGTVITVSAAQAQFLKEQKVGEVQSGGAVAKA
ncbi:MAG: DUF7210 family protein [Sinimarinibacterium flocculans]|jgi:hypothetical protein|uniref:DUF7210 family protein n=1 Tax=Sinimarinibacterium flocculans TaxID=985250 RepID=UPI003C58A197